MKYLIIPFIALMAYLIYQNKNIKVTEYNLNGKEDLRIVHLSDIHNWNFGKENDRLIEVIKSQKPEVILITGDFIDKRFPKPERCYKLAKELVKIAPVYYVRGNHEVKLNNEIYINNIKNIGFNFIQNEVTHIRESITLIGLDDCSLSSKKNQKMQKEYIKQQLDKLSVKNEFTILMSHQPQHLDTYSLYPIDLVLCGHAHGGQVRFPVGLFAPGQGILPKYYQGLHQENGVKEIISRGIGNSLFPLRGFNNPEVITINIKK